MQEPPKAGRVGPEKFFPSASGSRGSHCHCLGTLWMMVSGTRRESMSLVWERQWVIFWYSGHRNSVNAGGLPGERSQMAAVDGTLHVPSRNRCNRCLKDGRHSSSGGLGFASRSPLGPLGTIKKIKKQEGWFPPQTCAWPRKAVWSSIYLHCIECSSSRFIYLQAHMKEV